jgi:hypothetical protein
MTTPDKLTARMVLPPGGKQAWTAIMQGRTPVPQGLDIGSPIVLAIATFDDGVQVIGGVSKGESPETFNPKLMWVFDSQGQQVPNWPIDVSDHEDFETVSFEFSLNEQATRSYLLEIVSP